MLSYSGFYVQSSEVEMLVNVFKFYIFDAAFYSCLVTWNLIYTPGSFWTCDPSAFTTYKTQHIEAYDQWRQKSSNAKNNSGLSNASKILLSLEQSLASSCLEVSFPEWAGLTSSRKSCDDRLHLPVPRPGSILYELSHIRCFQIEKYLFHYACQAWQYCREPLLKGFPGYSFIFHKFLK